MCTVHPRFPKAYNQPLVNIRNMRPFAIAQGLVTAEHWRYAMEHGARGLSERPALRSSDARAPVVGVTWREAQAYLSWLNYRMGSDQYRLPSEAEWEFVARQAHGDRTGATARHTRDWVGVAWQWVQDVYTETHDGADASGAARTAPASLYRVARGASWRSPDFLCRPVARAGFAETTSADDLGFRIAMDLEPDPGEDPLSNGFPSAQ